MKYYLGSKYSTLAVLSNIRLDESYIRPEEAPTYFGVPVFMGELRNVGWKLFVSIYDMFEDLP